MGFFKRTVDKFVAEDRHLADVLSTMAEIREEQGNTEEALQLLKRLVRVRCGVQT